MVVAYISMCSLLLLCSILFVDIAIILFLMPEDNFNTAVMLVMLPLAILKSSF